MEISVLRESAIPLDFDIASKGSHSGLKQAKDDIISDAVELKSFFSAGEPLGLVTEAFPVFGIALGERPTPGYGITVNEIVWTAREGGSGVLTISYEETTPPSHRPLPQVVTTPYVLISLIEPRAFSTVVFRKKGDVGIVDR